MYIIIIVVVIIVDKCDFGSIMLEYCCDALHKLKVEVDMMA